MITNRLPRLLRAEAGDLVEAGGTAAAALTPEAPAAAAAPVAPPAEPVTPPAAPAAAAGEKPANLVRLAMAAVQTKGGLLARANQFEARALKAESDLAALQQQHAATLGQLQALQAERTQIEQALTRVEQENATADQKAAAIVAGIGIDPSAVPAAVEGGVDTVDSLMEQLKAESDPDKRYALAAKINALENA